MEAMEEPGAVAEAQIIALPQHRRSKNRELVARRADPRGQVPLRGCAPNRSKRADGTRGESGA